MVLQAMCLVAAKTKPRLGCQLLGNLEILTFRVHFGFYRGQLGSNSIHGLSGIAYYIICAVKGEKAFPYRPSWHLTRRLSKTLSFRPCFEYGRMSLTSLTQNSGLSLELPHTHIQQNTVQVTGYIKQTSFLTRTLFAAHNTDIFAFS